MQAQIAQMIALTTWGNAMLQGKMDNHTSFWPGNGAFTFCESCQFMNLERNDGQWNETAYAANPNAWFEHLRQDGVQSLRLIYEPTGDRQIGKSKTPERMLAGFSGGGGRWLLEARKARTSDYWVSRWDLGDRDRTDQKIWRVKYGRTITDGEQADGTQLDVDGIAKQLQSNLIRIAEFARSHGLNNFATLFESGISYLTGRQTDAALHHQDMTPPEGLNAIAAKLLSATRVASVFGGMGSWNDLGFDGEDQTTYEQLSEELYALLNAATVAAANTSAPTAQRSPS